MDFTSTPDRRIWDLSPMRLGGAKSKMNTQRSMHVYEVRPRKDKRGADLIQRVVSFFWRSMHFTKVLWLAYHGIKFVRSGTVCADPFWHGGFGKKSCFRPYSIVKYKVRAGTGTHTLGRPATTSQPRQESTKRSISWSEISAPLPSAFCSLFR